MTRDQVEFAVKIQTCFNFRIIFKANQRENARMQANLPIDYLDLFILKFF